MKSIKKNVEQNHVLRNSFRQQSPYEYLRNVPRYEENIVDLQGQKFKIADSLSFYWNYREIFLGDIYKFNTPKKRPVILDCGSNYGASVVYFKSLFPEAKIVAIEADPIIFQLLEWNIRQRNYENVILINKAVSVSSEPISFYREGSDGGRTSFPIIGVHETFDVETINLDDLIQEPVDFLKMDIEGSEAEVICSAEKLKHVEQLFIEYHSFKDSEQTLSDILKMLSSNGFRYYLHTQFCSPKPLTEEKLNHGMDLQLNIFAKKFS